VKRALRALAVLGLAMVIAGAAQPSGTRFGTPIRVGFEAGDDWEPAVVCDAYGHLYVAFAHADPNGPYRTRLMVQRSDDGGVTWNAPIDIAPAPPKGSQFDPWFAIDPLDGRTVSVAFLSTP
jgi:hypothetical protein